MDNNPNKNILRYHFSVKSIVFNPIKTKPIMKNKIGCIINFKDFKSKIFKHKYICSIDVTACVNKLANEAPNAP